MKSFIKELITNRFGIVLAALNVCYFVAGDIPMAIYRTSNFSKIMICQNAPSAILTFIPLGVVKLLFPFTTFSFFEKHFGFAVFLFFVTLQWLFIAWLSRKIAQKLSK